jgi:Ca-activated chloride channel homolog
VIDTSGSMSGDKIEDAKRSVLRLIADMRDDDEIAVVRYDDTSQLVQPLTRVGSVRGQLSAKIREINAGGGTNIPGGLSAGLRALDEAAKGRVRRIVLASDGLDGTRTQAEALARTSFASGITISSLGIGLDFDESYMASLAQNGHGNFVFVKDGGSLASFLKRELEQTAMTTIENARVKLKLPENLRFVSASGADAVVTGDEISLSLGSLFAGDERRVIVELSADVATNASAVDIATSASWNRVGSSAATIDVPRLTLTASADPSEVERGRDGAVLASATSVLSSRRQIEAANAYAKGDVARAVQLSDENERALAAAKAAAPPAATASLESQLSAYSEQKKVFRSVAPRSTAGSSAAKSLTAKEMDNVTRKSW